MMARFDDREFVNCEKNITSLIFGLFVVVRRLHASLNSGLTICCLVRPSSGDEVGESKNSGLTIIWLDLHY